MDNNKSVKYKYSRTTTNKFDTTITQKLRKKIIVAGALVLAVAAIIYIIPKYWDVAGGGGTIQTAPDSIKAGEAATIKFEVSIPGSQQNINGRYTDIVMHYNLTEFDSNFTQPKLISQTKDKEIYEFTIPPYPVGTQGEISYYIELKLDGDSNRVEGYKKIKVGEYSDTNNSN